MAKKKRSNDKQTAPNGEDIMNSLRKNVQQLLPRRIEFMLAKTTAGARPKSVNEEIFTRESEETSPKRAEPINKEEVGERKESDLQLFKKPTKKRFGKSEDDKQVLTASKASQIISNTAREWLNLPKRKFATPLPEKKAVSKPLPAQEVSPPPSEPKHNLQEVFKQIVEKSKKAEETDTPVQSENVYDWSEEHNSFEHLIESKRHEALKEWEDMRKPDEWDMALDQGKQRKVRKHKNTGKNHFKSNPFQAAAEKKHKRT